MWIASAVEALVMVGDHVEHQVGDTRRVFEDQLAFENVPTHPARLVSRKPIGLV